MNVLLFRLSSGADGEVAELTQRCERRRSARSVFVGLGLLSLLERELDLMPQCARSPYG